MKLKFSLERLKRTQIGDQIVIICKSPHWRRVARGPEKSRERGGERLSLKHGSNPFQHSQCVIGSLGRLESLDATVHCTGTPVRVQR